MPRLCCCSSGRNSTRVLCVHRACSNLSAVTLWLKISFSMVQLSRAIKIQHSSWAVWSLLLPGQNYSLWKEVCVCGAAGPCSTALPPLPGVWGDFILPGRCFPALHLSEKGMTSSGHVTSAQVLHMTQVVGSLSPYARREVRFWGAG